MVVSSKTENVARGSSDAPIGKHAPMLLGARYFLGLAVMPVCEHRVIPRARNGVHVWGPVTWCSRINVGADLWGPGYSWGSHQPIGILNDLQVSEVTQFCGDQLAPAHGQWRKLVETASHSQVVKWVCVLRFTQRSTPDNHRHPPIFSAVQG